MCGHFTLEGGSNGEYLGGISLRKELGRHEIVAPLEESEWDDAFYWYREIVRTVTEGLAENAIEKYQKKKNLLDSVVLRKLDRTKYFLTDYCPKVGLSPNELNFENEGNRKLLIELLENVVRIERKKIDFEEEFDAEAEIQMIHSLRR